MKKKILNVEHVFKNYKKKIVLKDVSFEICSSDIILLLGENGAGKSTLLKIITGLVPDYQGGITICDNDIQSDFVSAISCVGSIVEAPSLYKNMTGYMNLVMVTNIVGKGKRRNINELISLLSMNEYINKKVSQYSFGMKQRLGIAIALLNKPQLLILDEPTNGLDPLGVCELRSILMNLAKKMNIAILVSSHHLLEMEKIASRIMVLHNASLKELELEKSRKVNRYCLVVENLFDAMSTLHTLNVIATIKEEKILFEAERMEIPDIIHELGENDIGVYEIYQMKESTENMFYSLVKNAKK